MSEPSQNPWHALLHTRLRGQPVPLLVLPDTLWSAASLWAGTRAWIGAFRAAGLQAGDVLLCALPEGAAFVQVLLACLWDGIVFAPTDPAAPLDAAMQQVRARVAVGNSQSAASDTASLFVPDAASQPPLVAPALREVMARRDGLALLVQHRDVAGSGEWCGVLAHDLHSELQSALAAHALAGARVLSAVPWRDVPGLVHGLLLPLLAADELVLAHACGADRGALTAMGCAHEVTHLALSSTQQREMGAPPGGVVGCDAGADTAGEA